MDALIQMAIAGTRRAGEGPLAPASPAEAMAARIPEVTGSRLILLAAGARATYRRAGFADQSPVAPPEPAPGDRLRECSEGAAHHVRSLLGGEHDGLLPEALERLRRANLRLPHDLLPAALDRGTRATDLQPDLAVVVDARGRWLGAFNPAWGWVTGMSVDDALPADADTLWQEGNEAERLRLLRAVRQHDPERGRAWITGVWKQEKAEFRTSMVESLATGLSLDDEEMLESALDDRGQQVRAAAARLLARLPDSALALRMRERADRLLHYNPPPSRGLRSLRQIIGRDNAAGRIAVTPPTDLDNSARRDGIVAKPPPGFGERAWWTRQIVALVPPGHWEQRFETIPSALVAAARHDAEWGEIVADGWSRAAILYRDADWAAALGSFWLDTPVSRRGLHATPFNGLTDLIHAMRREDAGQLAAARLRPDSDFNSALLGLLPTPWSNELGRAYLEALRHNLRLLGSNAPLPTTPAFLSWSGSLALAARALPPGCFQDVLRFVPDTDIPDRTASGPEVWVVKSWQRELDRFHEIIRIRQRLVEEIPT